jgi:hypothetical protein
VINLKTAKQIGVTIPQKVLGHVWLKPVPLQLAAGSTALKGRALAQTLP